MQEDFDPFLAPQVAHYFAEVPLERQSEIGRQFEPVRIQSGEILYRRGDEAAGFHIVLAGRLEVRVPDASGAERVVGHLTPGDCGGEVGLITGAHRTATVVAIRSSVLAYLSNEHFNALVLAYPEVGYKLARLAVERLTRATGGIARTDRVRTIAMVPLDGDVPIGELGRRLEIALLRYGSTMRLDRMTIEHRMGGIGAGTGGSAWGSALDRRLDEIEGSRRFVIYQADPEITDWTLKCVSQADRVLFVANANSQPGLRPLERALLGVGEGHRSVERDLVLVHRNHRVSPGGTIAWLEQRKVDRHFHVALEGRRGVNRFARHLAGRAVSLVLGGGGARGFAQLGVIRAIREAGIPIDAAGGSSIGAIIAGIVALDWHEERMLHSVKHAFVDERPLNDYTLPLFALLRGEKVSRALKRWFGEVDIADMWTPYFCVTSNLSRSARTVHRSGTLWKAMRASVSLPGILPPFVFNGELHVDGGVLDNLPVEAMKTWIGGRTIAVDTSVRKEYTVNREHVPTALEHLRQRLLPRSGDSDFPTLSSVLIKSTTLSGSSGMSAAERHADLYLNPPTQGFDFLDWGRIFELVDLGYHYARERVAAWAAENPELVQRDELLEFRTRGNVA